MKTDATPSFFWIVGVFDNNGCHCYGHADKEQLEWWRDGLRLIGMTGLKGITSILGPKSEADIRKFCADRNTDIISVCYVRLPWEQDAPNGGEA